MITLDEIIFASQMFKCPLSVNESTDRSWGLTLNQVPAYCTWVHMHTSWLGDGRMLARSLDQHSMIVGIESCHMTQGDLPLYSVIVNFRMVGSNGFEPN